MRCGERETEVFEATTEVAPSIKTSWEMRITNHKGICKTALQTKIHFEAMLCVLSFFLLPVEIPIPFVDSVLVVLLFLSMAQNLKLKLKFLR